MSACMRIPITADVNEFIRLFEKLDADPLLKVATMRALGLRPAFARGVGPSLAAQSYETFIRTTMVPWGTSVQTVRPLFPREGHRK